MKPRDFSVDITGWTEDQILAWEITNERFATDERAEAAMDAWDREHLTPEVIAEGTKWGYD